MSAPAETLLGDFHPLAVVARTFSSDVHLVRHDSLGPDPVVLKVLRATVEDDERQLFVDGNALAARLPHPNLVEVLATGVLEDGRPWVAMPHHGAGSLEDVAPLPLDTVLRVGVRIADVLDMLHGLDVLHRDVKPANVLLADDGEPVLIDLHTAGRRHRHTGSLTTGLLTRDYAAPEVPTSGRYDVRSEIYSLGATLATLGDDASPALDALLVRMTSPEPDLRPSTCAEVARQLRAIERAEDLPVTGPTAPLAEPDVALPAPGRAPRRRSRRAPRRRRLGRGRVWPAVVTGTAVLAVSATVAVSALNGGSPASAPAAPAPPFVPPSVTEQPVLAEDFDDRRLDPARWTSPSEPAHLYARDRALHLVGTTGSEETVDTTLAPRRTGEFRQLDFVTGAVSAGTAGPGGGSLVVTERGGRTHKIVFGPSPGEDTLLAAALICRRASCSSYDDYVPPPRTRPFERYDIGDQVPIRLLDDGKELTIWMRDTLMARTPISGPLVGFAFNAYAEAPESWHLTVDALRVYA